MRTTASTCNAAVTCAAWYQLISWVKVLKWISGEKRMVRPWFVLELVREKSRNEGWSELSCFFTQLKSHSVLFFAWVCVTCLWSQDQTGSIDYRSQAQFESRLHHITMKATAHFTTTEGQKSCFNLQRRTKPSVYTYLFISSSYKNWH